MVGPEFPATSGSFTRPRSRVGSSTPRGRAAATRGAGGAVPHPALERPPSMATLTEFPRSSPLWVRGGGARGDAPQCPGPDSVPVDRDDTNGMTCFICYLLVGLLPVHPSEPGVQ